MSASVDNESEILLGNKQLLAIFAVVALLLAVAFTGGYMLGKGSAQKKASIAAADHASDTGNDAGPVTKTITPDDAPASGQDVPAPPTISKSEVPPVAVPRSKSQSEPASAHILGEPISALPEGVPKGGQTFIQVTALTHRDAEGTAEVLRKQNFRARIAPKPGSTTIYRVLVGPIKDAADLAATRDALRKIGFRDVFAQHY